MPPYDRLGLLQAERPGGEVIEEQQRFCALHDQVVHAHGDEIDADRVVASDFDRHFQLRADAVRGGDEHRIVEACRPQIEQCTKAAQPTDLPWADG